MKKQILLTDQEINVILFALQKQSFEMVNEVFYNVLNQSKAINEVKQELKAE